MDAPLNARREPADEPAEVRLAELARAAGPLRRVLAALAGQLVERRRFEPLGYARLGDYARERLGVSARTVQELARVSARLPGLPRLEAALVSGRLPWSKVRLLARFVSADDEGHFIARAEGVSVRRLERELRAVDRGRLGAVGSAVPDPGDDEEPTEVLALSVPIGLAFRWQRTCGYAAKVACETTPPGRVLEWVTGEVPSGLPAGLEDEAAAGAHALGHEAIEPGWTAEGEEPDEAANVCAPHTVAADAPTQGVSAPAPELPHFLRPLLDGVDDADAHGLDARLRQAIRLGQRLEETVGEALLSRQADPTGLLSLNDPEQFSPKRRTCAPPTRSGGSIRLGVRAPREVARLARAALCSVRLAMERETGRLPSEAEGFEASLDHALQSWQVEDHWLRNHSRQRLAIRYRSGDRVG